MFDGMPIEIGGKKFTMPPLGLEGLKKTTEMRATFGEMSEDDRIDATIFMAHAALVRNYPDLTLEEVREQIHAHEVLDLVAKLPQLMEKSGLKSRGEARKGSRKKA